MGLGRLSDGLAPTPPMGWNSWNRFKGNVDERLVIESAEASRGKTSEASAARRRKSAGAGTGKRSVSL